MDSSFNRRADREADDCQWQTHTHTRAANERKRTDPRALSLADGKLGAHLAHKARERESERTSERTHSECAATAARHERFTPASRQPESNAPISHCLFRGLSSRTHDTHSLARPDLAPATVAIGRRQRPRRRTSFRPPSFSANYFFLSLSPLGLTHLTTRHTLLSLARPLLYDIPEQLIQHLTLS